MYRTASEDQHLTLMRLIKAMDRQHPVTIAYRKADGTETVRTIEIYEVLTTKAGDVIAKAMDRETGDRRTWRLDRISSYSVHRTAYLIERPAGEPAAPVVITAPWELTAREIARDDRDYWTDRYHLDDAA